MADIDQHIADLIADPANDCPGCGVQNLQMHKPDCLLPCPFCGGAAGRGFIDAGSEYWAGRDRHIVECANCLASVEGDTEQEAREKWNRRNAG